MNPIELVQLHGGRLLQGMVMTLELTLLALVIAAVLALPLALMRTHTRGAFRYPVRLYISFFRGTPLIGQMFLLYYGAGQFRAELQAVELWWLLREPFACAVIVMGLNSAAYQAEILRGGIQNTPRGEVEAGIAVGMSPLLLLRKIILPHSYRIAFPALGNEVILLLKASAIASVVTVYDLMGETKLIFAKTFDFSVYLWAALLYLFITTVIIKCWSHLEIALSPQLQPAVNGFPSKRSLFRARY